MTLGLSHLKLTYLEIIHFYHLTLHERLSNQAVQKDRRGSFYSEGARNKSEQRVSADIQNEVYCTELNTGASDQSRERMSLLDKWKKLYMFLRFTSELYMSIFWPQ